MSEQPHHYMVVRSIDKSLGGFPLPSTPQIGATIFLDYSSSLAESDRYNAEWVEHMKKWHGSMLRVVGVHYDARSGYGGRLLDGRVTIEVEVLP